MPPFVGPPEPSTPIQALHSWRQERPEYPGLGLGWKVGPVAASLFDALATRDAIERGGVEANPVMAPFAESTPAMLGVKLGSGLLTSYLANRLAKSGHRNMGRFVSGLGIAVPTAAGAFNLSGGRD